MGEWMDGYIDGWMNDFDFYVLENEFKKERYQPITLQVFYFVIEDVLNATKTNNLAINLLI